MFTDVKKLVQAQFEAMKKLGRLLQVQSNRDRIWETYLLAFPEAERQEHNCNCCRAFIRQVGNVVVITPELEMVSIWDVDLDQVPEEYKASIACLACYVKELPISGLFQVCDKDVGKDKNFSEKHQVIFEHFFTPIPQEAYNANVPTISGEFKESAGVLKRGLTEITDEAVDTVLEIIAQGSLYRGSDYKHLLEGLKAHKKTAKDMTERELMLLCWHIALTKPASEVRVRNTAIGTLLIDLSEGRELEEAVKAFEKMVAPSSYKRPTAIVTPRMVEDAKKKLEELGMLSALERRRLDTRDLGPHNALFVHRGQEATKDIFAQLTAETPIKPQSLSKCEEVTIEKFQSDILPTCKKIRLLVENRHMSNFVTLTGSIDPAADHMFNWESSFGWSYSGGVADSMREKVVALGGRVDGVLRFTHSWNWDDSKPNGSLMDLHVFFPDCKMTDKATPICIGRRVGWNMRNDGQSGGVQDVDYTSHVPAGYIPVENITFPRIDRLPEGTYRCAIHNWRLREPTKSGFQAEIEFGGEVHQYQYDKPLKHKEWVDVAEITLKDGKFTIDHKLPTATGTRQKWGVGSNQWTTVKAITLSPNHWGKASGMKHWFFLLEGCVSDEATRPFYNEFLCSKLSENRKVMEVLGSKIQVADAEGAELSGVGFSVDQRNHVFLELEGAFKRVIKVVF